jgi:hypothetical protein
MKFNLYSPCPLGPSVYCLHPGRSAAGEFEQKLAKEAKAVPAGDAVPGNGFGTPAAKFSLSSTKNCRQTGRRPKTFGSLSPLRF